MTLPGSLREQVGVDERVEVPVEDPLRVPGLVAGAVVLDLLVGVEDIAPDPFAAESGVGGAALSPSPSSPRAPPRRARPAAP